MSLKSVVMIGMSVGSIIGGYIPTLFGADIFSMWGLVGSTLGAVAGIYISYRLMNG